MTALASIIGEAPRGTITIRGVECAARVPEHREVVRAAALCQTPQPPMRVPGHKGSAAKEEPDYEDPGYRMRFAEHARMLDLLALAIAIDLDLGPKPEKPTVVDLAAPALPPAWGRWEQDRPAEELAAWVRGAGAAMLRLPDEAAMAALGQLRNLEKPDPAKN